MGGSQSGVEMDETERTQAAMGVWTSERGFSGAVLLVGWLLKVRLYLSLLSSTASTCPDSQNVLADLLHPRPVLVRAPPPPRHLLVPPALVAQHGPLVQVHLVDNLVQLALVSEPPPVRRRRGPHARLEHGRRALHAPARRVARELGGRGRRRPRQPRRRRHARDPRRLAVGGRRRGGRGAPARLGIGGIIGVGGAGCGRGSGRGPRGAAAPRGKGGPAGVAGVRQGHGHGALGERRRHGDGRWGRHGRVGGRRDDAARRRGSGSEREPVQQDPRAHERRDDEVRRPERGRERRERPR